MTTYQYTYQRCGTAGMVLGGTICVVGRKLRSSACEDTQPDTM